MKKFNATQAKNQFGQLLDDAQAEPVIIQKNGRDVAVLVSMAEYQSKMQQSSTVDLARKYLDESMERYDDLYAELAK